MGRGPRSDPAGSRTDARETAAAEVPAAATWPQEARPTAPRGRGLSLPGPPATPLPGAGNQLGRIWSGLLFPSWLGWGQEGTEKNQLCPPPLQLERRKRMGREQGRSPGRWDRPPGSHPGSCPSARFTFVAHKGPSVGALAE